MHTTEICLKDGRKISGIIVGDYIDSRNFGDSYIKLLNFSNDKHEVFYVRDIKNATTEGERISISKLGDLDEIERMKYYYENGFCDDEKP